MTEGMVAWLSGIAAGAPVVGFREWKAQQRKEPA